MLGIPAEMEFDEYPGIIEIPVIAICPLPLPILLGGLAVGPEVRKTSRPVGGVVEHDAR
jgi:hypothetical protein